MDTYGDPGFRYHRTAAQVWGLMALRIASGDVLPFDPTCQATGIETYLDELRLQVVMPRARAAWRGRGVEADSSSFALTEGDLAPLEDAVAAFRAAADSVPLTPAHVHGCGLGKGGFGDDIPDVPIEVMGGGRPVSVPGSLRGPGADWGGDVEELNERLGMVERRFLSAEGLPGRPWYRHVLQGPGLYLG